MVDRINLILQTKNMSASEFANKIGVQRSNVSHVLSGRNRPSLDFIQKILKRFPDINADWLLLEKGSMYEKKDLFSDVNNSKIASNNAQKPRERNLFSDQNDFETGRDVQVDKPGRKAQHEEKWHPPEEKKEEKAQESSGIPFVRDEDQAPYHSHRPVGENMEIEKIVIFYKNRIFKEYSPGD